MAEEEQEKHLFWRGDPDKTFSDWTIEIATEKMSDDEIKEVGKYSEYIATSIRTMQQSSSTCDLDSSKIIQKYFVHRVALGYGARKCSYFEKQFHHAKEGNFVKGGGRGGRQLSSSPSLNNTSRIDLPALAAAVFPYFLDYMYDPRMKLAPDVELTNNWAYFLDYMYDPRMKLAPDERSTHYPCDQATMVCFHFLDDYFGNSDSEAYRILTRIIDEVDFGESVFYVFSKALGLDDLISIQARCVGEGILGLELKTDLIQSAGVNDFWMEVAGHIDVDLDYCFSEENKSAHWSRIIFELSKYHAGEFTYETFVRLTSVDILPVIHPKVAEPLFRLETKLKAKRSRPGSDVNEKQEDEERKHISIKDRDVLVLVCDECKSIPLKDRCYRCHYLSTSAELVG